MNWSEIADRYKNTGINLIEKTNEGTRSLKNGLGKDKAGYLDMRRTHKVLLRMGFEFLIKSLYLKMGWNIYKLRITPIIRFEHLSSITESDLNLSKTIEFGILIDKLNLVVPNNQELVSVKSELHKIREEGNNAIHSDDIQEAEIENIRQLQEKITHLA